jgi:hypothetical protein
MKTFVTKIGVNTIGLLFALITVQGYAQPRTTKTFNTIFGTTNVENAYDSTYVLKAERNNRTFIYKTHNKISLLYLDSKDKKQKKIKGEIVAFSDSTITIYQLLKNEQTEVPLKNIVRFSRANKSLFRYMAIIAVLSVGDVLLNLGSADGFGMTPLSIPGLLGIGFDGYAILPAIVGEICRKHYRGNGWKLKTIKYPNYIVHAIEYRQ